MLDLLPVDQIEARFRFLRDHWVLIEADLALIYGVAPERLLRCLRPFEPLPGEFCFHLEDLEARLLAVRPRRDGRLPRAFTEQGALVAGCILGTHGAIAQSIHVARLFARLRHDGMGRAAPPAIDYTRLEESPTLHPQLQPEPRLWSRLPRTSAPARRQPSLAQTP